MGAIYIGKGKLNASFAQCEIVDGLLVVHGPASVVARLLEDSTNWKPDGDEVERPIVATYETAPKPSKSRKSKIHTKPKATFGTYEEEK